ncbi:hypothetical protein A0H81_14662 [Grifola frondosa]|uniref:Uncharacterized protein n=1 Tax=Grifola frondosa TaxID=5627 RepID=A0A1C7LN27_GRIFR|nr:hypothetical protein A0H81_14662 [Grifola frondosa]
MDITKVVEVKKWKRGEKKKDEEPAPGAGGDTELSSLTECSEEDVPQKKVKKTSGIRDAISEARKGLPQVTTDADDWTARR